MLDVLPSNLVRLYSEPNPALFADASASAAAAPAAVLVSSDADYALLICRLLGLGMVDFTQDPKVVNGLFGTAKDDGRQRLVIDARRANMVFA